MANTRNLKPWPKGVSGNPGGRPKSDMAAIIARAIFENNPEAIYEAYTKALKRGSGSAFQVLSERGYGKLKESIDLNVTGTLAERLEKARKRKLENMTAEEIDERIRQLETELGVRRSSTVSAK